LATGRTHQIRAHAAHLGHPVAADARYGDLEFNGKAKALGLKRLFLHAHELAFDHQGKRLRVKAPLPADLAMVLETLAGKAC